MLGRLGADAVLSSGGTELIPRMKYGLVSQKQLVSLKGVPCRPPAVNPQGELCLDALSLLADLVTDPQVKRAAPLVAEAAREVASNQVRHMATLGGNLCQQSRCLYFNQSHAYQFVEPCFKRGGELCYLVPKGKKCWAVFMSDLAPALIALEARVELVNAEGARVLPLESLYSGDSLSPLALEPGEIVARLLVPPLPPRSGAAFLKFSLRGGVEFAGLNLAAVLTRDPESGQCTRARLIVGAVSGGPLRARKAEQLLTGKALDPDTLGRAGREAAAQITPFPHHGYSTKYLKKVLAEEAARVLDQAARRAGA